jgi:hypothetical protein
MNRFMLVILGSLAVSAVVAVASTSASATPLCKNESGGTHFALCFGEPLELVTGSYRLHINNDPTKPTKAFELTGAEIEIKCLESLLQLGATLTASVAGGKSLGIRVSGLVAHFVGCLVPKPAHCVLKENLVLSTALDAVPTPNAEDKKFLVLPETGGTFSTITFESSGGTCLIAGKSNVTSLHGKQEEGPLCNAPDTETTSILHLAECTGAAGTTNLRLDEEEVGFKGNVSALLEGQKTKWAVILGK